MAQAYGEAAVPTGRHGLPPAVVFAQQRERLFSALVAQVAEQGYRNTSIDQIVKSAKVGYTAFYDLFGGKEDCFIAAFDRIAEETAGALAKAAETEAGWPQQIAAALACLLDLIADQPDRARFALVEVHTAGPRSRARCEEALSGAVPMLRRGRALNPQAVELSPLLEEAILGGIAWTLRQRLLEGNLAEADPPLDELVEITAGPYVGN